MATVLDLVKHYQHAIEKYSNDEHRILKSINKLFNLDVTVQHLQETGVGRTVNALRKEPGEVGQAARALVYKWKLMVAAEESDQDGDRNPDTTNYNGHENERDSDENTKQKSQHSLDHPEKSGSSVKINKVLNGDYSGSKRKYQSSEDEEPDSKKRKNLANNCSYKSNVSIKKEPSESASDDTEQSHSDNSDSELSEASYENRTIKHEIKSEPPDNYNSKCSSSKNQIDHKKESAYTKRSIEKHSKSLHRSESLEKSSEKSLTKEKSRSSHKHKSSKEKEGDEKQMQFKNSKSEKDRGEKHELSSSKNKSVTDKHKSSNSDSSSEKHKSNSDKHSSRSENSKRSSSSHKSAKEKNKCSSEKEISSEVKQEEKLKCKDRSHNSKEKHSSSSKEKSKDRNNSSKEKSDSHKSEKKQSSSDKSKHSDKKHKSDKKDDKNSEKKSKHRSSSSSSKSASSSSKPKEDVPKKKVHLSNTDSDDGIDCGSGASFAEALGMITPTKSKKKEKSALKDATSPNTSNNNDLSPAALLAPTAKLAPLPALEISALPEISPNYKPRPPPKLLPHFTDEEAMSAVISSKNQRTKVYSGNKVIGKIPTLYEMCVQILQEHIDALEYTGGVPYDILKPVVDRANPQQLFVLEHFNPYLMEETDHLWQKFCEKHFRNKQRQEMETWREMYMRCQEEQEHRLKSLTANIKIAQEAKKAPIKQTKMAYVDTVVKPPRNIARKQAMHGTAHAASASPAARVASLAATPNILRGNVRPTASASISSFQKPKKAPLMQKALQFMRGRKR